LLLELLLLELLLLELLLLFELLLKLELTWGDEAFLSVA
jgi:hypothetical protein